MSFASLLLFSVSRDELCQSIAVFLTIMIKIIYGDGYSLFYMFYLYTI